MYAIKTSNLLKQYGKVTAVDQLNLEIKEGELFSLLGLNGAGKTTTLKLLSTLVQPSEGDAEIFGHSINRQAKKAKLLIGISPQETAVAPNLTVKENLEFICGIHGFSSEKTRDRIDEITNKLYLKEVLNRRTGKLSGGYQRRISIAMALISEPRILFLDEPTRGLDVIARHELWKTIASLKGSITIILTTHYMEEVEALSDRVGIMQNGKLLAVGTVGELTARYGDKSFESAFISIVKEGNV